MTLISDIIVYPSDPKGLILDVRLPFSRPFMFVAFNYWMELTTKQEITTHFEPKISLS
jgi:hypothetical protein